MKIILPSGPWEDRAGGFPHLSILLSGYDKLWNDATLCITSLPLTLGSASKYASHPGQIALSTPPVCPVWVVLWPFTDIMSTGATASTRLHMRLPSLSFSLSVSAVHSDTPTFICLNLQISQTCLCAEQEILCWNIAVQPVINSRGETWGSSHTTVLLISFHVLLNKFYFCVFVFCGAQ